MAVRKPNFRQRLKQRKPLAAGNTALAASRQPAAGWLMAVGQSLLMPGLGGVPAEHRFWGGDVAAVTLARTLAELDIAVPGDWNAARHDPAAYVLITLERWIADHGGEAIRRRFELQATLCSSLDDFSDRREEDPDGTQLFLTVEASRAAYLVLGPALESLSREHPQLAVTFFHLFTGALGRWLRVYDYRDAQDRVAMLEEWIEGEEEREQYELPAVEACIPGCLKEKPLTDSELATQCSQVEGREVKALLDGVVELARVSESAERPELTEEMREQLFDSNPALPGLLAVFHENDAVEGCFDEDSRALWEMTPEPCVSIAMSAHDPASVRRAFETFGVACRTLALASRLMDLMPGNERWIMEPREEERP